MNIDAVKKEVDEMERRINSGEEKYLVVVGICSPEIIDTAILGHGSAEDLHEILWRLATRYENIVNAKTGVLLN